MKKMKKALFAVLAAFSLSACDFDIQKLPSQVADTVGGWIDSIKDLVTGGGDKEKEKGEEEEQPCEHQDADHDGVCDLCGEQGLVVTHIDANNDHLCDVCGAEVSQCKDDNHDHICDICGATVSTCKDENNDFKCDICGKDLAAVSFELDTSAATTEFAKGQEFSSAGLKVIVTSEVGSKQELSGEALTVEAPSTEEVGEKTVAVSYEFAGVSHSDEYKINVTYWTEDDLELFNVSGLTFTRYAAYFPYLAGFNMRTEYVLDEDNYITDWSIVADNISDEALLEYVNMLASYESVASLNGKEVTFKLNSVAGNYEGLFGLSDVNVFSLIPYYVDNQGYNERFFVNDEYIAVGINGQGQMVLKNRFTNAMLDGMFFGDEYADGSYYFPAAYNSYLNYLPEILGYYYSELSPEAFLLPSLAADVYIVPINLVSVYPFEESLDEYDLAWFVELGNAKEQCYLDYCAALEAAGFEAEALESGRTSYSFSDPLYGYFEIIPGYDAEAELSDGSIGEEVFFSFYYIAPDSYTNHLDFGLLALEQVFDIEFEMDNSYYEDYGFVGGFSYLPEASFSSGSEAAESVARTMLRWGFDVIKEIKFVEDADLGNYYSFEMSNATYDIKFYVDEAASEDGYGFEVAIYDAKEYSVSNAERALQAAFYAYTQGQALALKGVDYIENEDGSFAIMIPVPNATAANLEYACTTVVGSLLGSSFEVDSSAAGEDEGTWVTVFKDTANNVLVTVTGTAVEGGLVLSIVFENHAFITPETTMIDFLTAASGSAPQEGAYTVNAEDGSCVAKSSIAGEFTAEDLAGLAGQVAQFLPEGFEAGEAGAASESSYVAYFSNEETNIECTITVSLGESGADVEVKFGFIPEVVQIRADEQAMIDILTALWGAVEDGDYEYDADEDMFVAGYYGFNKSYTSESYNQPICEYLASLAPSTFSTYQAGATTVSNINAYRIVLVDYDSMCIIQITVLVHPSAGYCVFQILTYLVG